MMRAHVKVVLLAAAVALVGVFAVQAGTLEDVQAAGELKCGINTGLPGFAFTDDMGRWTGFDVAYCRALAAAVLGDADKISFVNLTGKTRFPALQAGEIDVLSRNTTWTLSRDVDLGLTFVGVTTTTGRASSAARRWASRAPRSWTVHRSASRPAPPPSSTWRTSSAATT